MVVNSLLIGAIFVGRFLYEMAGDLYKHFRGSNNVDTKNRISADIVEIKSKQTDLREKRLPRIEQTLAVLENKIDDVNKKLDKINESIKDIYKLWDTLKIQGLVKEND